MNKSEKATQIDALHEKLSKAVFVAAIGYGKVDAETAISLRAAMRKAKIDYKVVKNTLALRAAKGTAVEKLEKHFAGPVAVAIGYDDMIVSAKAVTEFLKTKADVLQIKGAVAGGDAIDAKGVEMLAKMPGLKETQAMLLALINTPATNLVRLLNEPGAQVARVVQANVDKGQKAA